ncbi:MAG: hypothetical protein ACFB2Z_11560 [Maricaulaceae bacterium]
MTKPAFGLQPGDQAVLARLQGAVEQNRLMARAKLPALPVLVLSFVGALAFDFALVHGALAPLLDGTGQDPVVLSLTFLVAIGAFHFLAEQPVGQRLKAWLEAAVRRAIPLYLIGFGVLLAFATLQYVAGGGGIPFFPAGGSIAATVSALAVEVLSVVTAVAEPVAIILTGLALSCLFILSVYVGQACLSKTLAILGAALEAGAVCRRSRNLLADVRAQNARVVETARAAADGGATTPADIIRQTKGAIITARDQAIRPLRRIALKARLEGVEDLADAAELIAVTVIRETKGLERLKLSALTDTIASIEAATSHDAMERALLALCTAPDLED